MPGMRGSVVELDLVLAGSAAAGAYGAGALDLIMEAVGCLDTAREEEPDRFPGPDIRLKPRAATPAGALSLAALARDPDTSPRKVLLSTWSKELDPRDALGFAGGRARTPGTLRLFDPDCLRPLLAGWTGDSASRPDGAAADLTLTIRIDPAQDHGEPSSRRSNGVAALLLPAMRTAPEPAISVSDYWIFPERSQRPGVALRPALASTVLEGYGGYLDADFRAHDFALGRRNAQRFLARHLTLPSHHPLVADWSEALDREFGVWPRGIAPVGAAPFRPLVPLTGTAAVVRPLPGWPSIDRRILRRLDPLIAARIEGIAREAADQFLGDSMWRPLVRFVIAGRKRQVARETRAALEQMLDANGQIASSTTRGLKRWFSRRAKAV